MQISMSASAARHRPLKPVAAAQNPSRTSRMGSGRVLDKPEKLSASVPDNIWTLHPANAIKV